MNWTKERDILLCREILVVNPYTTPKSSTERGNLWGTISGNLNSIDEPRFVVDRRSVRDHLAILIKHFNRRIKDEEKQSDISPEIFEVDQAIMEIIDMEELY